MGKDKTRIKSETINVEDMDMDTIIPAYAERSYEEKLEFITDIAKPLAGKKLTKKLCKLIRKGNKNKIENLLIGIKPVQKGLRKNVKGIVILGGDVRPIDVMCHIPGICEDKEVPYCYIPSRLDIGTSLGIKRGMIMIMIKRNNDFAELYDECLAEIKALPLPI